MNREQASKIIEEYLKSKRLNEDVEHALKFALADMEVLQEVITTLQSVVED